MPNIQKETEEIKKGFGVLEKVTFVSDLLNKQNEIRNVLDMRTNIIIGFNSALIVFFATQFHDGLTLATNLIFLIPMATFGFSLALAIVALKPPRFMAKKGQKESLFYHHYIDSMSLEQYHTVIHHALAREDNIYDAYITETYNMTKFSNVPRKIYLYFSIRVLIYGIVLLIFAYALSVLSTYITAI